MQTVLKTGIGNENRLKRVYMSQQKFLGKLTLLLEGRKKGWVFLIAEILVSGTSKCVFTEQE